ncbi:MAG: dihydropteroate synthase [Mailhella sp.]
MDKVWMLRHGAFSPVSAEEQGMTPPRFTLWGIVNVTPDSFFDGGKHPTSESAFVHAIGLVNEGARILDLGGASSRPGSLDVSPEEEQKRVLPLLKELFQKRRQGALPSVLFSTDTWRASVAAAALEAGADIINDISACLWEPALADVLSQYRPGYVLMHCMPGTTPGTMQDSPHYKNVVDEVVSFLEARMSSLVKKGLPEEHIILDPGIGFGKTAAHNCMLLAGMERLLSLGRPILLGVSNKSLFGHLLGLDVTHRIEATNVCTALLAARGILHHRVHDVASARRALTLAENFTPWKD